MPPVTVHVASTTGAVAPGGCTSSHQPAIRSAPNRSSAAVSAPTSTGSTRPPLPASDLQHQCGRLVGRRRHELVAAPPRVGEPPPERIADHSEAGRVEPVLVTGARTVGVDQQVQRVAEVVVEVDLDRVGRVDGGGDDVEPLRHRRQLEARDR